MNVLRVALGQFTGSLLKLKFRLKLIECPEVLGPVENQSLNERTGSSLGSWHFDLVSNFSFFLKGDFMPRVYFLPSLFFFDGGDPTTVLKRPRFRKSTNCRFDSLEDGFPDEG